MFVFVCVNECYSSLKPKHDNARIKFQNVIKAKIIAKKIVGSHIQSSSPVSNVLVVMFSLLLFLLLLFYLAFDNTNEFDIDECGVRYILVVFDKSF